MNPNPVAVRELEAAIAEDENDLATILRQMEAAQANADHYAHQYTAALAAVDQAQAAMIKARKRPGIFSFGDGNHLDMDDEEDRSRVEYEQTVEVAHGFQVARNQAGQEHDRHYAQRVILEDRITAHRRQLALLTRNPHEAKDLVKEAESTLKAAERAELKARAEYDALATQARAARGELYQARIAREGAAAQVRERQREQALIETREAGKDRPTVTGIRQRVLAGMGLR